MLALSLCIVLSFSLLSDDICVCGVVKIANCNNNNYNYCSNNNKARMMGRGTYAAPASFRGLITPKTFKHVIFLLLPAFY